MSSQEIIDFLTKRLFIEKKIVTYRSLSRDRGIHVNIAKNELAMYHANDAYQSQPSVATYLLSGELSVDIDASQDIDMDSEDGEEEDDGESVPQISIVLVNEKDLEDARSRFTSLTTIHVYSLSPSPIRDAGLLCEPTEDIRKIDNKRGAEMDVIVGKIVGENINVKAVAGVKSRTANAQVAGPSQPKPLAGVPSLPLVTEKLEKTNLKGNEKDGSNVKEKDNAVPEKAKEKPKEKAKTTGKLDFTKGKAKEKKLEETPEKKKFFDVKPPANQKVVEKDQSKRGTKRKNAPTQPSEDEEEPRVEIKEKPTRSSVHVKKGVILSDDEDIPRAPRRTVKISPSIPSDVDSEADRDLHAMMDVEDDKVTRVSRDNKTVQKEQEEESAEEEDKDLHIDDRSSPEPKPKPKTRKPKKVVPVGRNGLKKKRTLKSKTTIDDKGYMVMVDYSSYESVNENDEPEVVAPVKAKAKAKTVKADKEISDSESGPPIKIKPSIKASSSKGPQPKGTKSGKSNAGSSKGGQKSLANFFGPPKPKK